MVTFAYVVWLAALHVMACGPDGDEIYRLLLGMAPAVSAMAFLLRVTRPFQEIHRMLSWLAVPLALLLPFGLKNISHVFEKSNLHNAAICSTAEATTWQLAWAPAQFLAVLVIVAVVISVWRDARRARDAGQEPT
jgi:beta-lactamase regulating signal transducer with metallopeptidase domain